VPTFFSDPPVWLYLLLGGALVVTGCLAAQRQDRRTTAAFGIAFLLMALLFVIDRTNESPREEAVRRTHHMAMAADAKNPDAFAEHVAEAVLIRGAGPGKTLTRSEVRANPLWGNLRAFEVSVTVWDFAREDVTQLDNGAIEIGFMGKGTPKGGQPIPLYLRGTFAKQPDGSYRLTELRTFEPLDRSKPLTIPGFF
jgi:hypothetical protein